MFGEFSITINGKTLKNQKGRTKRVWMLIQYLIARRHETIPLEQMVHDIWDGHECGDPLNALKNLVYRARKILNELSGDQSQFILFINGTYAWNNQYKCRVDSEEFLKYVKKAHSAHFTDEQRVKAYQKVIKLYKGSFLPKSAYSTWVIGQSIRYANLYKQCAVGLCNLLAKQNRFEEIVPVCKGALHLFPYEEPIHILLLQAYSKLGRTEETFDHYNRAVKMFYQEFGVDLSEFFKPYAQKVSGKSRIQTKLSVILNDLKEKEQQRGALFCDYDIFKFLYRFQVRTMPRTGMTTFLILFTLGAKNGIAPDPEVLKTASEKLKNAILSSMRKGDTVAPCSATQYIAMLQTVTMETAESVVQRVLKKFKFEFRRNTVQVTTDIASIME
ncbi:MAG: BTAD domain-containing protein [Oscillospiraceae bacterium]|jgi:DNA-binding SARP family transcriptional activator